MRRILFSALAVFLAIGLLGAGTLAHFIDTETSPGNVFQAGTLDLKVGDVDDPHVVSVTLTNMKPGDVAGYYKWVLRNAGSLPGRVSVTFSPITNDENVVVEPETAAEALPIARPAGELGQYLVTGKHPDDIPAYVTITERNDQEGWWIGEVSSAVDTGATIGWGPVGWLVPSRLFSHWQAGPPHPWGVPGLDGFAGRTFGTFGDLPGDVLDPGHSRAFWFRASLHSNLQRWTGTAWVDVDDNIIQSDRVVFDITFRLSQVTP